MNLGGNLILSQHFKSLNKLISAGKYDEAEAKLEDISNSLSTSDFDPKNKKGTLSLLLNNCLPLTSHENLKIRLHAQNVLNHWSSLVTSFLPKVLLDTFNNIDASQLKTEAHAAIFTFFTHALRCLQHDNRLEYLGILHSLLISSKPDLLTDISFNIWSLLRETLTVSNINSTLPVLINSPLAEEVAFLCEKSPDPLYNTVLAKANFDFIKQTIQFWPISKPFDLSVLTPRIVAAFESKNSSDISTSIEIITQIVQRMNDLNSIDFPEQWTQLINCCQQLWDSTATIAQKAAIIDLFATASFINKSNLENLLIFEENIPTPIKISIIKLCSPFIADGKIPKGLFEFIEYQLAQRDPLIFVAILDFLAVSFNDLHKLSPQRSQYILTHALTPLSQYFVEQISILHLLCAIDYEKTGVKLDVVSILLNFLNNPHPSLIPELKKTVEKLNVELPLTQLDWIGSGAMILQVLTKCDPFFICELIEAGLITANSYPAAIELILKNLPQDKTVSKLSRRALYVAVKAHAELGNDYTVKLNNVFTKEWRGIIDSLPELVKVINKNLKQTAFGMVLQSSLQLFVECMIHEKFVFNDIENLYLIATDLAPAFCNECCKIIIHLHAMLDGFKDMLNPKQLKKINELSTKFFSQMLPFDWSYSIVEAALQVFEKSEVLKLIPQHVSEACLSSVEILKWVLEADPKHTPLSPVFLSINKQKHQDYFNECVKNIPFGEWHLPENASKMIKDMKGIVVYSYDVLDYDHRKIIDENPESFDIKTPNKQKSDSSLEIPVKITLQGEFKGYESQEAIKSGEGADFSCPFNPYPHEKACSLVSLTNFLWFSTRRVSKADFKTIEQSLLPFAWRPRVPAAFLAYALRHGMRVKTAEWAAGVRLDARSDSDLVAFAILTLLGGAKVSDAEKHLRRDISSLLGLNYDDACEFAVKACLLDSAKRFAADAIIFREAERFSEAPFSAFLMRDRQTIISNFDNIVSLFATPFASSSMLAISSALFEHQVDSPYINFDVPPHIPIMGFLYKPRVGVSKPQMDFLALDAAQKFVDAFADENSSEEFLPYIIAASKLNDDQLKKFVSSIERLGRSHRLSSFVVAINPDAPTAEERMSTLDILPPSYSREVIVSFIRARTLALSKQKGQIKKLTKKIVQIFTELLPSGGSKIKRDIGSRKLGAFEEAGAFCDPLIPSMFAHAKFAMQQCETHSLVSVPRVLMHTKEELNILFVDKKAETSNAPLTPSKFEVAPSPMKPDEPASPSKLSENPPESPLKAPESPEKDQNTEEVKPEETPKEESENKAEENQETAEQKQEAADENTEDKKEDNEETKEIPVEKQETDEQEQKQETPEEKQENAEEKKETSEEKAEVKEEQKQENQEEKKEEVQEPVVEINSYVEFAKLVFTFVVKYYRYMFTITDIIKNFRQRITEEELYEAVVSKNLHLKRNIEALFVICVLGFPSKREDFMKIVASEKLREALACKDVKDGLNVILACPVDESLPEEVEEEEEEEEKEAEEKPAEVHNEEEKKEEFDDDIELPPA